MTKYLHSLFFGAVTLLVQQVLANGLNANPWGPVANGFQMSISLNGGHSKIKTNQPCILLVRYRNVSTNEIFWVYESTEHDPNYAFKVISPSGNNISPDMEKITHGDSAAVRHVPPGQTIEIKFNLSKLCRFSDVGKYKIIAKNKEIWAFNAHQSFTVVSNPLNVTVVPDEQGPPTSVRHL